MMTMNHSGFGVGDFLFYAIKQCTDIHRVCITTDAPVRLPSGEMCSAFTWECLLQSCRQLAAWYAVQKVGVGDRIALYMEDSVAYLLHQVALNSLGAVAVYANGALPLDSAIEYFKRVHVRGVILGLAQQDASHQFDELSGVFIHCHDNIRQPNDEGLPANYPYSHQDDDVVLISHTSGTTGVIKGVVQKHAHLAYGIQQFLRNRPAYSTQPAYCGSHRYLSLLPTAHNSFLAYSMRALLTDTPLRVICDRRPEHIARQIKEWQPSVVISFFMAYQNLVNASVAAESFSSVGYWINTGDAAHQPYIKRITAWGHHCVEGNMAAGSLFLDGLGSSEMGSTFFRLAHSCASKHPLRCVGPVRPGFSAAILSEDGRVLDNYMVGRLGVQGRSVTTGYSGDAVQSAQAQVNGYWLTGDLAYRDDEGRFIHVDRIPDAINAVSGCVYSLLTEEIIFSVLPELIECSVFPQTRDEVTVAQAIVVFPKLKSITDTQHLLQIINSALQDHQQPPISSVIAVEHEQVLRGVTGKVLKRKLAENMSECEELK